VIPNPDAVLYFTALPDFDVPITVDSKKTKMQESLEIWESVVQTPAFAKATVVLFLNKSDLFASKLKTAQMSDTFSDFKGGSDAKAGAKYLLGKFEERLPDGAAKDTLQCHVTCALDTEQIRTVFVAIRTSLTERALSDIGF